MTQSVSENNQRDYSVGMYTSVFSGQEEFLKDHVIQGVKILPGTAYLEIARAAVESSISFSHETLIVLSESVFVAPLIVTKNCSIEIRVYPGAQAEFGVEVSSDQGTHFQTKVRVEIKHSPNIDLKQEVHADLLSIKKNSGSGYVEQQEFYAGYEALGIEYGPSHRGVKYIKYGKDCALAHLSLPGSINKGMKLNPGMLDSVIQCAKVLSLEPEKINVPFLIKRIEIYGALTGNMYAYLSNTDKGINISVVDEDDDLKVVINGFEARELLQGSTSLFQSVCYQPKWQIEQGLNSGASDKQGVTIIEDQDTYSDLVKILVAETKKIVESKTDGHIIEVQLRSEQRLWRGIIGALNTILLEHSKIDFRLKLNGEILKPEYEPLSLPKSKSYWPDNKTILISGGLGGIGKLLTRDVAETSNGCHLILIGRRELNAEQKAWINDLKKLSTRIEYVCCDVTNLKAVSEVIQRYPDLNGVIHAAGIIKDSLISQKNLHEIDEVLSPKIHGIENLDQATQSLKLDYFIALSSISGAIGNPGQIDYAAANGYMDEFIQARAQAVQNGQRFGKSISINWPLWESDGMQISESSLHHMKKVLNISPMPAVIGLDILKRIIEANQTQSLIFFGDPRAIAKLVGGQRASRRSQKVKLEPVKDDALEREILREITAQAAKLLKLDISLLDEDVDWIEFGFDSILVTTFINQLNAEYNLSLMPSALFEATNLQMFSQYLMRNYSSEMANILLINDVPKKSDRQKQDASIEPVLEISEQEITSFAKRFRTEFFGSTQYRESDIAIVGMSCKVAGAKDVDEFWSILDNERDMISEIPVERWDWRAYSDSVKWGSFMDDVAEFDPLFFGISPAEALYMVPEQRLMMESVWECLENAGCGGEETKGTNTGIFIASVASGYTTLLNHEPIQAYSATGMVPSVGPNRISHLMNWSGPSEPVETACSSSLVAVHRAVEAIRLGHCKQAIVGGVNLLLTPDPYISFTKSGMLSTDGRCKTFSDKANGYVRGEGLGMLMLKPLNDAISDGNMIHAVIKGTAVNHGGHSQSLTAPNPKSQAAVISKAIENAGIDFDRVSYIECHGTGTALGDAVEIDGLKMAAQKLGQDEREQVCVLGSAKSNIGHLEMAAGIVGLIKVVLQLQHKKIVKSLHCENINPYIDLSSSPYSIAQRTSEWGTIAGRARVAGVSSFGFGGVNAHVVLEEFLSPNHDHKANESFGEELNSHHNSPQLLLISARDEKSLLDYAAKYSGFIDALPNTQDVLQRIAYTMQVGRSEMDERVVFVAGSIAEWAAQLDVFLREKGKTNHRNIYRGSLKGGLNNYIDLGDSQTGRDYIRRLAESGESRKLAELWVKGSKIHWRSLHE